MAITVGQHVEFRTGKKIYANNGIVGIDANYSVFEGFDGDFGEFEESLTDAERIELADMMLNLWQDYKTRTC